MERDRLRSKPVSNKPVSNKPVSKIVLLCLLHPSSSLLGLTVIALASLAMLFQQRVYERDLAAAEYLFQAPQTPRNRVAQELDEHLGRLGLGRTDGKAIAAPAAVGIVSQPSNGAQPATPQQIAPRQISPQLAAAQFAAIQPPLLAYLKQQRHARQAGLLPLPEEVTTYLAEQQSLGDVQAFILANPLPVWELEVEKIVQSQPQSTSFFPIADLQRLLMARGLAQYNPQGDPTAEATTQSFEAAWRLTEAVAARPDLLSQIAAGILQQQQLTLLRHLDLPSPQWEVRLAQDYQRANLAALAFDSWIEYRTLQAAIAPKNQSVSPWASWFKFDQQYLQFSRMDWLAARQRNQQTLAQQSLCEIRPEQLAIMPSRLNLFGSAGAPELAREWIKAGDRQLGAELTQAVRQAKQLASKQGSWPWALPDLASQVCPGVAWHYHRQADGGMVIALEQPPHWRVDLAGDWLPLSYEAAAFEAPIDQVRQDD